MCTNYTKHVQTYILGVYIYLPLYLYLEREKLGEHYLRRIKLFAHCEGDWGYETVRLLTFVNTNKNVFIRFLVTIFKIHFNLLKSGWNNFRGLLNIRLINNISCDYLVLYSLRLGLNLEKLLKKYFKLLNEWICLCEKKILYTFLKMGRISQLVHSNFYKNSSIFFRHR